MFRHTPPPPPPRGMRRLIKRNDDQGLVHKQSQVNYNELDLQFTSCGLSISNRLLCLRARCHALHDGRYVSCALIPQHHLIFQMAALPNCHRPGSRFFMSCLFGDPAHSPPPRLLFLFFFGYQFISLTPIPNTHAYAYTHARTPPLQFYPMAGRTKGFAGGGGG